MTEHLVSWTSDTGPRELAFAVMKWQCEEAAVRMVEAMFKEPIEVGRVEGETS